MAATYADLFAPLLETQERHLRAGLDLWLRHPQLGCFDAVLAAVAGASGGGYVISADSHAVEVSRAATAGWPTGILLAP